VSTADKWAFAFLSVTIGIISFLGGAITHYMVGKPRNALSRYEIEQEATKAGVAYYELNQRTGKIEFHYVDINQVIRSVIGQLQMQQREVRQQELQ
jgi:hypothetical protein